MANYSIFVLDESDITFSSPGAQLDGVTQGDGSHLVGQTLTLDTPNWTEIFISDGGSDTDFRDNDGNQRLDGAQEIDGTTYSSGTRVEAEYGLSLSDGVNTWQVVGFNVRNSSPAYGTVEGLAFIGGPGGFPPTGVPLTVTSAQEGPNFDSTEYATPICYVRGTRIDTPDGPRRIEDLKAGDRVSTGRQGSKQIRWIGSRSILGAGRWAPVEIPAGVLGARAPLRVSQQHRLLLRGAHLELLYGHSEVFAPAISLVDAGLARAKPGGCIEYFHILLEAHSILHANGVASESLYLGDTTDGTSDVAAFFPELSDYSVIKPGLAHPALRRREADMALRLGGWIEPNHTFRHSAANNRTGPGVKVLAAE